MKLLIATRNPHKLAEIRSIFRAPTLELVGVSDVPGVPEIIEDGDTLEANALKKATEAHRATGWWTLADDSGLEVDALDGAPGVRSARYAGEPCNPAANNAKLLAELGGRPDRRARFRCVIALAGPGFEPRAVDGRCQGVIAHAPRGNGGFGYDPLFIPDGFERTFAELAPEEKNRISHRARALAAAWRAWGNRLLRAAATETD